MSNHNDGDLVRLLTIQQAATVLACSQANVYRLIESGELPVVPVGASRGFRIDYHDIEEFVRTRKTEIGETKRRAPLPRPRLKHIRL